MAYSPDDVTRSLQRYYAEMLGDNDADDPGGVGRWEWRRAREEVADDARPVAVIDVGAVRPTSARTAIDQGNVVEMMPYTVTLYPKMLATPRESAQLAHRLAGLLVDALMFGLDLGTYDVEGRSRPVAGPYRLPLWDWSEVPVAGTAEERTGPAVPHDHLWVEDVTGDPIQDPLDAKRWTVVSDARVSWERPGRRAPTAPLVAEIIPEGSMS